MTAVNVSLNKTPQLHNEESLEKMELDRDLENLNEVSLHGKILVYYSIGLRTQHQNFGGKLTKGRVGVC